MNIYRKLKLLFIADRAFYTASKGDFVESLDIIVRSGYSDYELSEIPKGVELLILRGFLWRETYTKALDESWFNTVARAIQNGGHNTDEKNYLMKYARTIFLLDNENERMVSNLEYCLKNVQSTIKNNFPLPE